MTKTATREELQRLQTEVQDLRVMVQKWVRKDRIQSEQRRLAMAQARQVAPTRCPLGGHAAEDRS